MSYSFADEPEGDGHRFVRQARTNMRAPAVKATGKIISSFCVKLHVLSNLKRKPDTLLILSYFVEGLSLLGAYEDSDDEDAGDSSMAKSNRNQSNDIDSTLANFMAVSMVYIT